MEHEIDLKLETNGASQSSGRLSEADLEYARSFAGKIDLTNKTMVLQYGLEAERKVRRLSESLHLNIPEYDLNEIESLLRKLQVQLSAFEISVRADQSRSAEAAADAFRRAYDSFNSKLTECARRLEILRSALLRHVERLKGYCEDYLMIIREFDLYLYAGQVCLAEQSGAGMAELLARAEESGFAEDRVRAEQFAEDLRLFSRKLHDLSVSRQLPVQMTAHLRMIQSADIVMAENLRRLIMNVFPLYRSRITLAIGRSSDRPVDMELFSDAGQALKKAVVSVLKEEEATRAAQKVSVSLFGRSGKETGSK